MHPYESPASSAPPGSPEYRKKGRFELSGNVDSPRTSITASLMGADLHAQVEMLLKQNEIQKNMLQDLLSSVGTPLMHTKSRSTDLRKTEPK